MLFSHILFILFLYFFSVHFHQATTIYIIIWFFCFHSVLRINFSLFLGLLFFFPLEMLLSLFLVIFVFYSSVCDFDIAFFEASYNANAKRVKEERRRWWWWWRSRRSREEQKYEHPITAYTHTHVRMNVYRTVCLCVCAALV